MRNCTNSNQIIKTKGVWMAAKRLKVQDFWLDLVARSLFPSGLDSAIPFFCNRVSFVPFTLPLLLFLGIAISFHCSCCRYCLDLSMATEQNGCCLPFSFLPSVVSATPHSLYFILPFPLLTDVHFLLLHFISFSTILFFVCLDLFSPPCLAPACLLDTTHILI